MEHWNKYEFILNADDNDEDEDEDEEDDNDNNDVNDKIKLNKAPRIKEKMTTRKYREVVRERKMSKYRAANYHQLWIVWYVLSRKERPDFFIVSKDINDNTFTLYDIICYLYILWYGQEYEYLTTPLHDATFLWSLTEIVLTISSNQDEKSRNDESHFQAHKKLCQEKLNRFFDLIFEESNSIALFQNERKKVFNVLDYGFFCYLLDSKNKADINHLCQEKYDKVSSSFYHHIYIGLNQLVEYHNVKLSKTDLDLMFIQRFKISPRTFRLLQDKK